MLVIFAVIIGGIATGRLLIGRRLAFVQRLITVIIWALQIINREEMGGIDNRSGGSTERNTK